MASIRRLLLLIGLHLLVSAVVASAFASAFGHSARTVAGHVLLLAEWDGALVALFAALAASMPSRRHWPRHAFVVAMALTCSAQIYLYVLDAISNGSWGRNITAHVVFAFAPTVWSGREQFPGGRLAARVFIFAPLVVTVAAMWFASRKIDMRVRWSRWRVAAAAVALVLLFAATLDAAVTYRDNLFWKDEPLAGFFRPDSYAFEPTNRRYEVEQHDAVIEASYPRHVAHSLRKNVILIIVDSLRADHMQVYGYPRATTPFLSGLVQSGRMKKVASAFSTCSESFCGITSTLSGREFRDISARTFQLQDVLRDEGYQTWFLLSGNHSAWNGLPQFYHAPDGAFFDGSMTQRYSVDDDRLVLEGLERVPPASDGHPAFFYIHLMSTHYLGVHFEPAHFRRSAADDAGSGFETYEDLVRRVDTPDRYDDKVLQADDMVRQVFAALAAKHYMDDALVVVIGDHGEGLGERHFAHGWNLYDEDIRIPMLLYDPGQSYPDLSFATQVDVAPTIVDRLGLPVPASWEGESLLHPMSRRFTFHQTYFLPNRFAVLYRDGSSLLKFIATPQYGKEELYDLRRDPGEVHNLAAEEPAVSAVLRERVRAYRSDE